MPVENQHYVPRFMLKRFSSGKKPKVWVYDKSDDRQFSTNIKNIAAEKGFYNFDTPVASVSMEPLLSDLEGKASGVIKKICTQKCINTLTEDEASILILFVSVQFVRTKEYRERFSDFGEQLKDTLKDRGVTDDEIDNLTGDVLDEHAFIGLKAFHDAQHFLPQFANKAWILFEACEGASFYISDNPVVLHNDNDYGPYGNLGISVKGIQIYFPLSSTLCLAMYCPTLANQIMDRAETIRNLDKTSPGMADRAHPNAETTRNFSHGLENGTAIIVNIENVQMMNSLQVTFSTRYVYDEKGNFEVVKKMIRHNNEYRSALWAKFS